MPEPAVRAKRLDASTFPGPSYKWEAAGKPVTVEIPLTLIDQLETELVGSFRSLSSLGSEIGGVLFGTVVPGKPEVNIRSYELISCDYTLGPLYHLSDADLARLDRAIAQAAESGMVPAGFFRSHTRKGLSLDAEDRKLLGSRFSAPHCIALLIRPFAAKASTAGIFIWENGEVQGETSYLEFPFRSSLLGTPVRPASTPANARGQIVPIATRREPVVADLPLTVAPPAPQESPAKPAPAAEVAQPAAPPVAESAPQAPATESATDDPAPAPTKSGKRVAIYVAAALVAGVLILGAYFGGLHRGGVATPLEVSNLALRVERSAGELLLTWNRDSAVIKNASRALLEISDGPQHENVTMDLAQLRNGSIVYSPATADVVFKMDIIGKDEGQITSESVRVLRTRPSPLAPEISQAAPQPASQQPSAAAQTASETSEAVEEPKPASPPRATRAFNTESLAQRLRPATPADLPDAPAVTRGNAAPIAMPQGLTSDAPAPAPPPPPPTAPAPAAAPEKALAAGGQIQTAELVYRKDPEYPRIARESGVKGTVRLTATIGADGKVKSVKILNGHPLLVRPATEAVMQWIYKPTYLNGVAMEAQTEIILNFVNDR